MLTNNPSINYNQKNLILGTYSQLILQQDQLYKAQQGNVHQEWKRYLLIEQATDSDT